MNELDSLVESARQSFAQAATPVDLENAKARFLGKSGSLTDLLKGMAIGMAAEGLKPVCEIQFAGFDYLNFAQIECHASRLRHRSQGRHSVPMVMRSASGSL